MQTRIRPYMKRRSYSDNVKKRAYELYNMKAGKKRIYVVKVIPAVLASEFGLRYPPSKQSLFDWFKLFEKKDDTFEKVENQIELTQQ